MPTTVRAIIPGEIRGLDPIGPAQGYVPSIQAWVAAYDSLVSFLLPPTMAQVLEQEGEFGAQPQLATNWETSADTKTVRFDLRQGVMSSFGNEMTAADVKYSFDRNIAGAGAGAAHMSLNGITDPNQIVIIDDYTIEFNNTGQYRLIPTTGYFWYVVLDSVEVAKHVTADDPWAKEWLATNTAGFGPYTITSFLQEGREVTFQARDDYWGEKPTETVTYQAVDDASARLQLMLTGEGDYTEGLTPLQLSRVRESEDTKVVPLLSTIGALVAVTFEAPFDDLAIRKGIAQALPYQAILDTVYQGQAQVVKSKSPLAPFVPGYTEDFDIPEDPEAAKAALAGIAGAKLEFVFDSSKELDRQISILVQLALNDAGLDVTLRALPTGQYTTEVRALQHPTMINTVDSPSFPVALYTYEQRFLQVSRINWSGYFNQDAEDLVAELRATPTGARADEIVYLLQEIGMRDLPHFPLVWSGSERAVAQGIELAGAHSASAVVYFQDLKWT
jgi:peptide/nickel transport system substrate-binding protein